jgi:transcriptional antiterminator NusG
MDEDPTIKDPQEPGMSDASPPEAGAELSAEPSAEAPSREIPASDNPAPVEAAPAEGESRAAEAEAPAAETEAPAAAAETPAAEAEAPAVEAEAAAVEAETPAAAAETPATEAEAPAVEAETPAVEAEAPAAAAETPATEAEAAEPEKGFDPAADLPTYRAGMDWFVLRVASNKENYVRETLLRKVQIEGLDDRVGRIMVTTAKTKTLKGGKTKITETKLYPGYIFVEMRLESDGRIPQDVFFLIKETTGVGDFVGTAGRPTPMAVHEAEKMLFDSRRPEETPSVKMEFAPGDYVTITEGPFESYEGTVDEVLPDKGLVRVLVTIFGRQAPVELEYWQIQKAE